MVGPLIETICTREPNQISGYFAINSFGGDVGTPPKPSFTTFPVIFHSITMCAWLTSDKKRRSRDIPGHTVGHGIARSRRSFDFFLTSAHN
jgi:hypothetical protein